MGDENGIDLVYGPDEPSRSTKDTIIYTLQWVLIMFYPVVWGLSIVGLGLNLSGSVLANYMVRIVFMIGVTTLIQILFGHKLAMITGPNIIPSLAIVSAFAVGGKEYALLSFNAYIIAGIVVALLGITGIISLIEKVWTPLVLGSMVMMVGLATSAVGMGLIAEYSASWPFYVGVGLALLCGWLSIKGKGLLSTIPVLITIVLGYLIFMLLGKFDWAMVRSMPTFTYPTLFPFGMGIPPWDLVLTMTIVHIFSAVNLYGNVDGYKTIAGIKPDQREVQLKNEKRYFTIFGLVEGSLAGLFGVPGYVSYGENLGFLMLTKVASRLFMIIASVIFIVMSFFGQIGGIMAAMPRPVAGAILLGVASTLIGEGASIWHSQKFESKEIFIVGFSIFFCFGISNLSESFYNSIPNIVGNILKNPVITVIILVILLEQIVFPTEKSVIREE